MSLVEELTRTQQATALRVVEESAPKGWRAGATEVDGVTAVTTPPYPSNRELDARHLLEDRGYDPDKWMIVGPVSNSSWDAYVPKKNATDERWKERFTAYRFKCVERPAGSIPIDELIEVVNKATAFRPRILMGIDMTQDWAASAANYGQIKALAATAPPSAQLLDTSGAWVHVLGDTQIGKVDGDGPEGTIRRVMQSIDEGVRMYLEAPVRPTHVHIAWVGDCIEGFVSQGGRLAWRTSLTLTEQVRVIRRLMLYAIDGYREHAVRITNVSVPGNHDEAASRQLSTRVDDSWAVDAMVAVSEAISLNPDVYGHVECYVPGPDQQDVTMDVGGIITTHLHGHQWRAGRVWDWWKGQTFGGTDSGKATLLIHGHFHHWLSEAKGDRMFMCVPALEELSAWWVHKTGESGQPSGLVFQIKDQRAGGISFV